MPIPVVFTTTVFDNPDHGPAVYARYLWEAFHSNHELDFHVVTPQTSVADRKIHQSGNAASSTSLYRQVSWKALQIAQQLGPKAIIHANNTHPFAKLTDYPGTWIVQVNDYEVARFWRDLRGNIRRNNARRVLVLFWRYCQEKRIVPLASRVICNSDFTRSEILRSYRKVSAERVLTIHKAVDTRFFRRPAGENAFRPDAAKNQPRLLFVGSNWRVKGLPELLAAVANVTRHFPSAELSVVGPAAEPQLVGMIEGYGLNENVRLLGRVGRDELRSALWNTDVLVMPSRVEAFGVAALEAMSAGVPVIASRVGGLIEIIRPNQDGLLVDPENPDALAAAICKVVQDPELRGRLVESGHARCRQFSVECMVEKIKVLYAEVAQAQMA